MPEAPTVAAEEPERLAAWLARNAVDSLPEGALAAKLVKAREQDRPLRVKLGIDPTAPDIHLGHAVVLRKLAELQRAGHTVVLIIGDYTARVGDPSGRSELRPMLSPEQIEGNATTFQEQALKILDADPQRLE
ncbi:MAG TPA: tyrosine--tRNA ligase, partial [Solirubrobacteraceae bacterium]|nr:tyrosine--tRNA ligase [Solirubrobacteraceae bacterium]